MVNFFSYFITCSNHSTLKDVISKYRDQYTLKDVIGNYRDQYTLKDVIGKYRDQYTLKDVISKYRDQYTLKITIIEMILPFQINFLLKHSQIKETVF